MFSLCLCDENLIVPLILKEGVDMRRLMLIGVLLAISISCYAQESQESYMLLLLDFEDRSGIENPLLAAFNDTISFILSRQTHPVRVRTVLTADRDALLAHVAATQPDTTLLEQGLTVAEWVDADALIAGSYTKEGTEWSLEAQVYHRREGRKVRQEIKIQADSLYKLLDEFPAHLLQQFTDASYVALTTDSWKAYEEFRKGHETLGNYNFLGALEYYDKALELDPTLALAYAEQSYAYFITGQGDKATEAINRALQYVSRASPVEHRAIQALAFCWDAAARSYQYEGIDFLISGGAYDEEWLSWVMANAHDGKGRVEEAAKEYELWFTLAEERSRWKGDDPSYLLTLASKCAGAHIHLDRAIEYAEQLLELDPPPTRAVSLLVYLYGQQGQVQKAFQLALTDTPATDSIRSVLSLGIANRWDALAQIVLDHDVPLEQVRQSCRPLMDSDDRDIRVESHYLLAWSHARGGDLDTAKSLYAQIGAPWEQDWWVIGPFDGDVYDLDSVLPPEEGIHLNQTYEGAAAHVGWKRTDDGYLNGYVEFTRILDFPEEQLIGGVIGGGIHPRAFPGRGFQKAYSQYRRIVYALIYMESENVQKADLRLDHGGDIQWKLWLNDTAVFRSDEVVTILSEFGEECVIDSVELRTGLNKILVKLVQCENRGLRLALQVTDPDGNPIPGLRFRPANEVIGVDVR